MAVFLQQNFAVDALPILFFQPLLHRRDRGQFRFDNAAGGCGFRECLRQIRREARQTSVGILNIVLCQANIR